MRRGDVAVALPDARSMRSLIASANYFEVLGVRPALGRVFERGDDGRDAAVAVIAHSAWIREFDADPTVIGRTIRVADQFVQIVGVAPRAVHRHRSASGRAAALPISGCRCGSPIACCR